MFQTSRETRSHVLLCSLFVTSSCGLIEQKKSISRLQVLDMKRLRGAASSVRHEIVTRRRRPACGLEIHVPMNGLSETYQDYRPLSCCQHNMRFFFIFLCCFLFALTFSTSLEKLHLRSTRRRAENFARCGWEIQDKFWYLMSAIERKSRQQLSITFGKEETAAIDISSCIYRFHVFCTVFV